MRSEIRIPAPRGGRLLLAALVLAAGLAPAAAAADEDPRARAHFERGAQAYREARYREAIDAFLAAFRLDRDPGLIFNVGQAWEKLGNVREALAAYRDYLRLAPRADDRAAVLASIRNLEGRLRERGVQQVSIFSSPPGAAVAIDERAVGATPWTGELSPGRHVAVLRLAGHVEARKEFVLGADRAIDLDVGLESVAVAAQRTPASAPVEPPAAPARLRLWTWGTMGLSVALLGGALGFELARRSSAAAAGRETVQLRYQALVDEANSRQTGARVLCATGLAAAATTGVLAWLDRRRGAAEPRTATIACDGRGCALTLAGSF
jgi:tetratricopeptide (TPR) repeat protein